MATRNCYAQMSTLIVMAWISQTGVVSQLMIDPDASRTREILDDDLWNSPAKFILSNKLTRLLSGPIKIVLENIQRYWTPEWSAFQNDSPVGTGQIDRLDNVQLVVGPIKCVLHSIIDGKRRRTSDSFCHE